MDELLEQFLLESRELVESATASLLALERAPRDAAQLDSAFRALHTLKGGAGIVEFTAMERTVHAAEDVLGAARAGRRVLDAEAVGDCLACLDQVLQWLEEIEATGALPGAQSDAPAARLIARLGGGQTAGSSAGSSAASDPSALPPLAQEILRAQQVMLADAAAAGSRAHRASAARVTANVLHACGRPAAAAPFAALAADDATHGLADAAALAAAIGRLLDADRDAEPAPVAGDEESDPAAGASPLPRTVRVDAARIDALARLTGELTVAKNALAHIARQAGRDDPLGQALRAQHSTLDHLTGELQRAVLQLRVLPLRIAFQRLPRLVREMSVQLGKPVDLQVGGEETEADKAIVEMLFEPLLHVVRNALDHGIEPAALRASRGKPPVATLRLRASRDENQVRIEVSDDGGGLDLSRIRHTAAARGIGSTEMLAQMDDAQVTHLVFAPGFSTAADVTALSGRGVGMDAVRTAIERVGGRVSLHTEPGAGTTVTFLLPFSVMMTTVISLSAGGQVFGVPLDAVVETLRVRRQDISSVGAARALVWRGGTIPLLGLGALLGAAGDTSETPECTVVIASLAGQACGLEVDAVGERLEVMMKPLDGLLAGLPAVAGTTLLGDGRVLLVLDVAQLLRQDGQ